MNQFDDYFSYGVICFALMFFAILAVNGFRYWRQLQEAFLQSGIKWPPYSQEELNKNARMNLPSFYKMGSRNMAAAARVIFTMRTYNPAIQKPLRGIRHVFLAFLLFPFLIAFVMVAVY